MKNIILQYRKYTHEIERTSCVFPETQYRPKMPKNDPMKALYFNSQWKKICKFLHHFYEWHIAH